MLVAARADARGKDTTRGAGSVEGGASAAEADKADAYLADRGYLIVACMVVLY